MKLKINIIDFRLIERSLYAPIFTNVKIARNCIIFWWKCGKSRSQIWHCVVVFADQILTFCGIESLLGEIFFSVYDGFFTIFPILRVWLEHLWREKISSSTSIYFTRGHIHVYLLLSLIQTQNWIHQGKNEPDENVSKCNLMPETAVESKYWPNFKNWVLLTTL